jgi:drug/metabolite transporter (DMT)-like permease
LPEADALIREMTFFLGVAAAMAGNCVIGVGQCLQKMALNRMHPQSHAHKSTTLPTTNQRAKTLRSAKKDTPEPSRVRDPLWIGGIVLSYLGDIFGNWIGMAFAPAAAITPLGIVSVFVGALLAQRWLKETITPVQKRGYAWIFLGVALILYAAPKAAPDAIRESIATPAGWLHFMATSSYLKAIFVLIMMEIVLIYRILVLQKDTLGTVWIPFVKIAY